MDKLKKYELQQLCREKKIKKFSDKNKKELIELIENNISLENISDQEQNNSENISDQQNNSENISDQEQNNICLVHVSMLRLFTGGCHCSTFSSMCCSSTF